MRKMIIPVSLASLLILLLGIVVLAAPTPTNANSQVTILSDGKLNVRYQITFVDDDRRNRITTLGPFEPGHQITEAKLDYAAGSSPINLVSQGGCSSV